MPSSWDIWARSTVCSCKRAHTALSVLPNFMSPFLIYYWCCSQPSVVFNSNGIKYRLRLLLLWQARIWMVLLVLSLKSWLLPSWFQFCLQGSTNWAFLLSSLTSPSYICICVCFFVLFCPPAHLCLSRNAFQTAGGLKIYQRVRESLSSMFTVIPYLITAGRFYFSGYIFRVFTKNSRVSGWGKVFTAGRRKLFSTCFIVVPSLILLNLAKIGRVHQTDKEKLAVGITAIALQILS